MEKRFDSRFALKAALALAIVLALLMAYSIALKAKPAPFSLLYFAPAQYSAGNYVAVLENRENGPMDYRVEFVLDNATVQAVSSTLSDGEKMEFPVMEYAPGFASKGATVEVRAIRQNRTALVIYATKR
jgi:hypothetical protein